MIIKHEKNNLIHQVERITGIYNFIIQIATEKIPFQPKQHRMMLMNWRQPAPAS